MTTLIKFAIAITMLFLTGTTFAQELKGAYSGTLDVQGMQLVLIYNITPTTNGYTATLDVPAQGASGIELDSVLLQDKEVTITSAKMQMKFTGILSENGIDGTYEQMGQKYPLTLKKTVKTKPGNTALPSTDAELAKLAAKETGNYKYSVSDYFKTPEAYSFQLSPDGKFISYMKRRETGERDLYLKETTTQKETLLIKQEEDLIRGYYWANNHRILYMQDKGGNENYHVFGVDTF